MSRTLFAIIFIAIVAIVLFGMWWGWRTRSRRDQNVAVPLPEFSGELIREFTRIMYVSTTPADQPLVRVAAPGLRYRGFSSIRVFTDGVEIAVTGEEAVRLPVSQLNGTGSARVRVGKAVERNGLTLLKWNESGQAYESTFRFENHDTEQEFVHAIATIAPRTQLTATAAHTSTGNHTDFPQITQEDVR